MPACLATFPVYPSRTPVFRKKAWTLEASVSNHIWKHSITPASAPFSKLGRTWAWPSLVLQMTSQLSSHVDSVDAQCINLKEIRLGIFWASCGVPLQTISSYSIQQFAMKHGRFASIYFYDSSVNMIVHKKMLYRSIKDLKDNSINDVVCRGDSPIFLWDSRCWLILKILEVSTDPKL